MTAESQSTADERITKNLEQTGRFLNEIVEDPDILDEISEGAMVFLLPEDDPELAEQNRKGRDGQGKRVTPFICGHCHQRNIP